MGGHDCPRIQAEVSSHCPLFIFKCLFPTISIFSRILDYSKRIHDVVCREGLSTALVFKALDLGACSSVDSSNLLAAFETQGALESAEKKFLVNDLEKPAFFCSPDLLSLKEKIANQMGPGASGVMMSGSGTSIYALVRSNYPSDKVSMAVSEVLKAYPTVQHFQCEFLNKKDDIDSWY